MHDYACTLSGKRSADGLTYTTSTAGDEHNLTMQPGFHTGREMFRYFMFSDSLIIHSRMIQKMMNGFRQVTKRHTNGLVKGLNARLRTQSGSRIIQLPIRNERFELRITAPI